MNDRLDRTRRKQEKTTSVLRKRVKKRREVEVDGLSYKIPMEM